jgi:phosphate uptake regulator
VLTVAYHIKRAGERVTNIAERIVFVRTGALAELDQEGQPIGDFQ